MFRGKGFLVPSPLGGEGESEGEGEGEAFTLRRCQILLQSADGRRPKVIAAAVLICTYSGERIAGVLIW